MNAVRSRFGLKMDFVGSKRLSRKTAFKPSNPLTFASACVYGTGRSPRNVASNDLWARSFRLRRGRRADDVPQIQRVNTCTDEFVARTALLRSSGHRSLRAHGLKDPLKEVDLRTSSVRAESNGVTELE
jgi:hypothetical protein